MSTKDSTPTASERGTHTPGPWVMEDGHDVIAPFGELLATAYEMEDDGDVHEANARLIAAAPDLLAALKMLLADIEDYQRINRLGGESNHSQVTARVAIAKAEGRA